METISVGIRDAKLHFSKLLKRVQQGEEVLLNDRGRPIAKIIPVKTDALGLMDRIMLLEERGIIGPVSQKTRKKLPAPLPIPDALAQRFLEEDRNHDGR
jgi:prevent-host-death family protein